MERDHMKAVIENNPRRQHPHMLLWLKTKIEIITLLFNQKRIEDCEDSITVCKLECMNIKD